MTRSIRHKSWDYYRLWPLSHQRDLIHCTTAWVSNEKQQHQINGLGKQMTYYRFNYHIVLGPLDAIIYINYPIAECFILFFSLRSFTRSRVVLRNSLSIWYTDDRIFPMQIICTLLNWFGKQTWGGVYLMGFVRRRRHVATQWRFTTAVLSLVSFRVSIRNISSYSPRNELKAYTSTMPTLWLNMWIFLVVIILLTIPCPFVSSSSIILTGISFRF